MGSELIVFAQVRLTKLALLGAFRTSDIFLLSNMTRHALYAYDVWIGDERRSARGTEKSELVANRRQWVGLWKFDTVFGRRGGRMDHRHHIDGRCGRDGGSGFGFAKGCERERTVMNVQGSPRVIILNGD